MQGFSAGKTNFIQKTLSKTQIKGMV